MVAAVLMVSIRAPMRLPLQQFGVLGFGVQGWGSQGCRTSASWFSKMKGSGVSLVVYRGVSVFPGIGMLVQDARPSISA